MNQASIIAVQVNGEPHRLASRTTVAQLLEELGHAGRRIAVERNGEIVPRSRHASTELTAGDRLEIVVAVGGG
jgi:sulfur carrier protein